MYLLLYLYTCQLFLPQRCEIFIRILWNHCAHIRKCPKTSKNLRRQSERFRRSSDHLWNSVPWYHLLWKNCHLRALFYRYCFEYKFHVYKRLHITHFPGVCQIWLQCLILFSKTWEIGPSMWLSVGSKFSTCRCETRAQGVEVDRYIHVYVVVQFYLWFKFYFSLFETHHHTLP